jgi:hypothetical protein
MNAILTTQFIYASSNNYPGAKALFELQVLININLILSVFLKEKQQNLREKPIKIHIDNFCAETGISRFLQLYDSWKYKLNY